MAVIAPIVQLGRLVDAGCIARRQEHLHADETRRLSCNPKGFWKAWREDILRLKHDWRTAAKELVLQVPVKCGHVSYEVRVLVDTGAKILLVFRHNLFPTTVLRKAAFPFRFSTLDGQTMDGGNQSPTVVAARAPDHRKNLLPLRIRS